MIILFRLQKATSPTALVTLDVRDNSSAAATTTAPASSSSSSGSFLFYVASRFGDSQLVRLDRSSNADADIGAEAELQLVASYPSLAPIIDCCLVEDEAGGSVRLSSRLDSIFLVYHYDRFADSATLPQSRLITCSGAYKTGSLRVVQRGVGLSEMAALEVPNVQRLWSIPEETDNG